jgi:predicted Zn-dependent peptidase
VPFHSQLLENGLQIIGETSPSARSVALGFFVRTGARDESVEVSGVTHFLEHMVFKGTPHRTALDVNRDFDRIGAHYNAFTSEENTVFYAAILPEYLPQAVDILADILRPSLRGEDFDMEKNVIIEEIGMYEDQPMWSAYDHAKRTFFADHPLGKSILGSVESIRALTRDQMYDYFQRRYVAPNVTVVAAGNFDWPTLVKLVRERCGLWETGPVGRKGIRPAPGSGAFEVLKKAKVAQEHVFLISAGPAASSPLRYAADTLALVLGDDSGSRLYWALVDPGHAESADTSFHDYEGTGSFYTSFSCEPRKTGKNLAIVQKVLRAIQELGITEEELRQAKSKILSRVVRSSERPMGRMQAIGTAWTYLHKYRTVDEELQAFDGVSLKTIRKLLDRYPLDRVTTLALGPLTGVKAPDVNGKKGKALLMGKKRRPSSSRPAPGLFR